jgi:hypothetical protein
VFVHLKAFCCLFRGHLIECIFVRTVSTAVSNGIISEKKIFEQIQFDESKRKQVIGTGEAA